MEPQPRPRKNTLLIDLAHAIVLSLTAVLFLEQDFLDIQKRSSRASEDAIYHLIAPLHGDRQTGEPIVVVTIDKEDLEQVNDAKKKDYGLGQDVAVAETWTWPLDGFQHREVLETLEEYKPRAVFYDINFATRRDGILDFSGALRSLTKVKKGNSDCTTSAQTLPAGATPVLLSYERNSPPLREYCEAGAEAAVTGWVNQDNNYPLFEISAECKQPGCASDSDGDGEYVNAHIWKSAAFGLFSLWCDDQLKTGSGHHRCKAYRDQRLKEANARLAALKARANKAAASLKELRKREPKITDESAAVRALLHTIHTPDYIENSLSLQWGIGISPKQSLFKRVDLKDCALTPSGVFQRFAMFFERSYDAGRASLKLGPAGTTYFGCPYHLTIPLRVLMYPNTKTQSALEAAIAGKLVMIGVADITGLGDVFNSPVHGQVPGVYVHAQATDDLLRSASGGLGVVTRPDTDARLNWRDGLYFILMTGFVTLGLQIGRTATRSAISFDRLIQHGSPLRLRAAVWRSVKGLLWLVLAGALALVLPALLAAFFYLVDRISPQDWIAIVVTMALTLAGSIWRSLGQILAELAVAFPPTSQLARKFLAMLQE